MGKVVKKKIWGLLSQSLTEWGYKKIKGRYERHINEEFIVIFIFCESKPNYPFYSIAPAFSVGNIKLEQILKDIIGEEFLNSEKNKPYLINADDSVMGISFYYGNYAGYVSPLNKWLDWYFWGTDDKEDIETFNKMKQFYEDYALPVIEKSVTDYNYLIDSYKSRKGWRPRNHYAIPLLYYINNDIDNCFKYFDYAINLYNNNDEEFGDKNDLPINYIEFYNLFLKYIENK